MQTPVLTIINDGPDASTSRFARVVPGAAIVALMVVFIGIPLTTYGHGGADETLFVAEDGSDRDRCLQRTAPCRTLGYALSVAGKGSRVQVAPGSYPVDDTEDLFHIVSGMIDVVGGMPADADFKPTARGISVLTGVPIEYRELLRDRGFHVVADRKGIDGPQVADAEKLLSLHAELKAGAPASPCSSGMAGDLECQAVDLLAHFAFADLSTRPSSANDVWGFVDLNTGREYAIMGYNIGTAVIDVSNPQDPVEVGFIDGQRATWRDIKVYQYFDRPADRWQAYAYVTTDGSSDGLFVVDLTALPHAIRKAPYASDFIAAHNVYATQTDYRTGIPLGDAAPTLVIAGSNLGSGRYRAYSLAEAQSPSFLAEASGADYMHDASSMMVSDSRKDSQCANAASTCEVLLDFNETTFDLWDISNPSQPARLSRTTYGNASYVHSGWWAEDRQHIFVHDELDEQQGGLQTTVRVFSVADLRSPVQVGTWTGPTQAIDHNGYVRGNRYYMSNYSRGLTVLDISDPAAPTAVGRLDTYPFSDSTAFVGAWGAFPYFAGNTVAISDIDSGLYMALDRSVDVPQGKLSFTAASAGAEEGGSAELSVRRSGGASGAISVAVEILHATSAGADVQTFTPVLNWSDGDASERSITVELVNDGESEGLEQLFVRLVDPRGGATLGDPNVASVFVSDPGAAAAVGFFADSIDVTERGFGTAVAVLRRSGSGVGAASVDWSLGGGSATRGDDFNGPESGTVTWADGDAEPRNLEFPVVDDGSGEDDEFFEVSLENASGAGLSGSGLLRVNILDGRGSNSAPNALGGGSQVSASGSEVTLDGSQSNDVDGDALQFAWSQTGGPDVTLEDSDTQTARFTAPSVTSDTLLQFRLTVTDPGGLSDSATATVTVTSSATASDGGDSGGGAASLLLVALFTLATMLGRVIRTGGAGLWSDPDRARSR